MPALSEQLSGSLNATTSLPSWPDPRIKSEGRLVPAIHAFSAAKQGVDGRDKRGHDGIHHAYGRLRP
jgi:hypothetical protein